MPEGGKTALPSGKFQLINVERMIKIANHLQTTLQ